MHDPALYDLLHQERTQKQTSLFTQSLEGELSFEQAFEKSVNEYVDSLLEKQDPAAIQFISPSARREKIENEIREASNFSEIEGYVATAIHILDKEGLKYLSQEENALLQEDLDQLRLRIEALPFDQLNDESLKTAFSISEPCQELMLKIGIAKFEEDLLPDSLAILSFLSLLDSENAEYAYRFGIIAQKNGRDEEALRAYVQASNLDPLMMGPCLFAAQCHFNRKELKEALIELQKAKNILSSSEENKEWLPFIAAMESLL